MIHIKFRKGKRVLIILNDGTKIVDRWQDATDKKIFFTDHTFNVNEIRSLGIYRAKV